MARYLEIDNYFIDASMDTILAELKLELSNGKLKDIKAHSSCTDNIVVTCPNNEHSNGKEANPDCSIYVGNDPKIPYGYVRCFACGFSGNFYKFVAACFDQSEVFAKKWLIKKFGKVSYNKIKVGDNIVIKSNTVPLAAKSAATATAAILDATYQEWCPYFAKRGLTTSTCQRFNLRYDSKYRQVIFPCYGKNGELLALLRRSIDTKTFYIPEDLDKPIYGLDNVYKYLPKKLIITEGLFDRLLAEQYGFPAIAILGTPSDKQLTIINSLPVHNIYLMFDSDSSGEKFTKYFQKGLDKRFIITTIKLPRQYKDIGELSQDVFWDILNSQTK